MGHHGPMRHVMIIGVLVIVLNPLGRPHSVRHFIHQVSQVNIHLHLLLQVVNGLLLHRPHIVVVVPFLNHVFDDSFDLDTLAMASDR